MTPRLKQEDRDEVLKTNRKFDAIFSNRLFHHLTEHEIQLSLKKQHALLNEKGLICHVFYTGRKGYKKDGISGNYISGEKAINLITTSNFEIVEKNISCGAMIIIARKK